MHRDGSKKNTLLARQRLHYGAVPLKPWVAQYPGSNETYFNASRLLIEQQAAHAADSNNLLVDDNGALLTKFMTESLIATHANRIDYNNDSFNIINEIEAPCEDLQHACDGLANPEELLGVLGKYPQLEALELAKLTHPLDYDASREMDGVLVDLLERSDAEILDTKARYKRKRLQESVPALIVVRKREIGDIQNDDVGTIRITQRQSLLIRGDTVDGESPNGIALGRMIKNPQRFDELTGIIETHFDPNNFDPHDPFIQPMTTSYYAKYV